MDVAAMDVAAMDVATVDWTARSPVTGYTAGRYNEKGVRIQVEVIAP